MHYSRVPRDYWEDRLTKFKAAGLNAVQTYVPWNFHETEPEKYDFTGDKDIEYFLVTAEKVGLYVILRAGPYICAEWEMGGLPSWLLAGENNNISLRSSDPIYLKFVDRWMSVLLSKVSKWLYVNGGNIISVQVENEYGSYPLCDSDYYNNLHSIFRKYLGEDVVLFTTDGANMVDLKCGADPQLFYATVDFGGVNASFNFKTQRSFEPRGPLVNSEYYTGWLDSWGSKHERVSPSEVAKGLDNILSQNASVNMYMFEGGTNFGFWSGTTQPFLPVPTSYDYDAPLTEAGDPYVEKFLMVSSVIEKYCNCKTYLPALSTKASYGKIKASHYSYLFNNTNLFVNGVDAVAPVSMENMGQMSGFILYYINAVVKETGRNLLTIEKLHDRATVFVDGKVVATLQRSSASDVVSANITLKQSGELPLLAFFVENMGRVNYGKGINDRKGILGSVRLNEDELVGIWTTFSIPLDNIDKISFEPLPADNLPLNTIFYKFIFSINGTAMDTFLDMSGWGKGVVFVNGFNLGRYWPAKGPQVTLYVPATVLKSDYENEVIVFEIDSVPCKSQGDICTIVFTDTPNIG